MEKEQKYYYGNEISQYGMENGRVDYATLSKCFDAVLNNDIMQLTYDIGYWYQVSGTVDNTDDIEELEEKLNELEEQNESSPSQILENEINEINDQIEELEREQDDQEVFQWYIVDDGGARLLQEINEIVYYNETLNMYLWGVTHYGTSWDYVLTSIAIDWQVQTMTIFNVRYTPNGINVYNYDYNYDHMFIFYTKKEIEKKVRETLNLKYKRGVVFRW